MIKSQSDTQLQLAGLDPLQNREFKIRKRDGDHKIEEVGKGLRSMFSWLKAS